MPNSPTPSRPPIDRVKLKQAADKLAALLNDFRTGGLQITEGDQDEWLVHPEGDWQRGVYARVGDPHGYWDTTEVNGPDPEPMRSWADRLRVLVAEMEALTAPCADGRCTSRYRPGPTGISVRCEREAGHDGTHLSPVDSSGSFRAQQWMWTSEHEVAA